MKRYKEITENYVPIPGFYDLRDFNIPAKDFPAFVHVQKFLRGWEKARKRGQTVPPEVKDVSAKYQQALFAYARKPEQEATT